MSKPLEMTLGEYLKDPSECPYCGSDEISGGHFDASHIYAYRDVRCKTCEHTWTETFELTNVTLEDESSSIN